MKSVVPRFSDIHKSTALGMETHACVFCNIQTFCFMVWPSFNLAMSTNPAAANATLPA